MLGLEIFIQTGYSFHQNCDKKIKNCEHISNLFNTKIDFYYQNAIKIDINVLKVKLFILVVA